jgi:hypothetical protein
MYMASVSDPYFILIRLSSVPKKVKFQKIQFCVSLPKIPKQIKWLNDTMYTIPKKA